MAMDEILKRLYDQRRTAVEALKAIQFEAEARGEWTAEDEQKYEKANAEVDGLKARYDHLSEIDEHETEMAEQREKFASRMRAGAFAANAETEESRIRAWIKAGLPDADEWAPRALDLKWTDGSRLTRDPGVAQSEARDLSKGVTTAGGFTVPTGFVDRLYQHLVEFATVREVAAILTTDSGEDLLVPKTATHGAAQSEIAEAGAIGGTDPTFAQATLKAFKYGQMVKLSTELVQDTAVDLLGYVAEAAGRNIGLATGTRYATGTGTGQPEGVATAAAVGFQLPTGNTLGFTTADSKDGLIDVMHSIVTGYRRRASWLMNDATVAKVRKLKDTTGQYLWQPGLSIGMPDSILGRPVLTDPNIAVFAANAKVALFGDFGLFYTIRDVNGIRFERSDDAGFGNDQVWFRILLRTDGRAIVTDAVKALQASAT